MTEKHKEEQKKTELQKTKKIIRIVATDIPGELPVERALLRIRGIGQAMSHAICHVCKIDPNANLASLDQEKLKLLENAIKDPDVPSWLKNQRRDKKTGKDRHVSSARIEIIKRENINVLRRVRAYRGIRHEQGLPVRGQRTRGSFRHNKTVGVQKRKAMTAKKGRK